MNSELYPLVSYAGLEQCLHCGGSHPTDPGHTSEGEGKDCVLPCEGEANRQSWLDL